MKPADQTTAMMPCYRCPTMIRIRPNVKYCDVCRPIVKAEQSTVHTSRQTESRRAVTAVKIAAEKRKLTEFTSSISDAEQVKLNRAVDDKNAMPCTTKIYIPGTAEFCRVAREATPLHHIRGREEILIYQTEATDYRRTRNESSDKL